MSTPSSHQITAMASRLLQATSNERSPSDIAKDATFIFLALSAGLFAMVASVYLATMIMDRYTSFCCPGLDGDPEDYDHGPLARRAGLWGLKLEERRLILNYLFKGSKELDDDLDTKKSPKNAHVDDIESQKQVPTRRTSSRLMEGSAHGGSVYSRSTAQEEAKEEPSPEMETDKLEEQPDSEQFSLMDTSEHDVNTCSICLSSFKADEDLMSGTNCFHTFHRECLFDWLMKRHDDCPYCRKPICSPEEMRRAAGEVLGSRRFAELTRWAPQTLLGAAQDSDDVSDQPGHEAANSTEAANAAGSETVPAAVMDDRDCAETEPDRLDDCEPGISEEADESTSNGSETLAVGINTEAESSEQEETLGDSEALLDVDEDSVAGEEKSHATAGEEKSHATADVGEYDI